jgi:phage-related protein
VSFSCGLTGVRKFDVEYQSGALPRTIVRYYPEERGDVPLLVWLAALPSRVRVKCLVRLQRLSEHGHELRRPEADYLRDGIYELRASFQGLHYRMLYFFHGSDAVVVSHGLTKERAVPPAEIDLATRHKAVFAADPERHTFQP